MFDSNGKLIIPTLSENMESYQKFYKEMFALVDISPASALGSDLAITAEMKKIADEFIQSAFMQNSPFEAIGKGLDNLCFLRGIKRKKDEHSIVLLEFRGGDGTVIPKGTIVSNALTDETFETLEQGIIVTGVFMTFAQSTQAGRIVCDALTINKTELSGVTVINPSDGVVGYLVESDTDLRTRLLTYSNSLNVEEELYIKLLNLQNVKYVNIVSNPELIADSNSIPPKSTAIVILGGYESAIAREIFKVIPSDKKTFGDVSMVVSSEISNNETIIKFSRPHPITLTVSVTITTDNTFNIDDLGVIKSSILNYVNDTFGIAKDVLISSLYIPTQQDYNNKNSPFKGVKNVSIVLNGSDSNITINYNQYAVLNSSNLTVLIA